MSSRFVSAGAIDPTTGEAAAAAAASSTAAERVPTDSSDGRPRKPNSDEWLAVEKELEAERRRREEARKAAAGGGERSLFEVLQANKEAKQAAFEEANKIRNQFRALDDDEIEFLDEVKARQREEEGRLRRETEESVEAFRVAQRRKERDGEGGDEDVEERVEGDWAAGRKRKRVAKGVGILKRKTTAGEGEMKEATGNGEAGKEEKKEKPDLPEKEAEKKEVTEGGATTAPAAKPKMGLVSYDSDDDDD